MLCNEVRSREGGRERTIIRIQTDLLCRMCSRIPKCDTHEPMRAYADDVSVSSSIGVACGHRVERYRRYQKRLTPLLVIVQERVKTVQFC